VWIAVLAALAWTGTRAGAGSGSDGFYLTNVEMMQLVARGAVAEALRGFPGAVEDPIRVTTGESGEADWLVETELVSALAGKGIAVEAGDLLRPKPRTEVGERKGSTAAAPPPPADLSFPVDTPPALLSGSPVPYPPEACAGRMEGSVSVRLIVNEQGSVANVIVDESSGEPFESAVQKTVEGYRYRPGQNGGSPTPSLVKLLFRFPVVTEACESAVSKGVDPAAASAEAGKADSASARAEAVPEASHPPVTERGTTLSFRVSEMEMRYPDVGRRFGVGPKRVERFARMRVDLRLKRAGQLLWAGTAEHYASDRVPFGALPYLESDAYAFAKPEIAPGKWGRVLEPVLVSGMIGGLVFLFYANQTSN
jgi:TonB family protein